MTTPATDPERRRSRRLFATVIVLAAVASVAVTALLINIFERKQEAKNPFYRVVELNDTIDDPATWAKNFPMQYDLYTRTVDMQRTKYGGSEAMPHSPTEADPRSVVARSKLQEDPRLKTIWAGYAFSADYRERRGHAYMLRRPDLHRAPEVQPAGHVHQLPRLAGDHLPEAGRRRPDQGLQRHQRHPHDVSPDSRTCETSGRLHRLSRSEDHAVAHHASGVHGRHSRAEGFAGSAELRRQHHGHAPGDALLRVRSMPRNLLLPAAEQAAHLSLGKGPEGRRHHCGRRRAQNQRVDTSR